LVWKRQETPENGEEVAAAAAAELSLFSSCPAVIANTCNLSIGQGKKMDLFSTGPKPKWNPNVKPF